MRRPAKSQIDTCPTCEGIGSTCMACDKPIDDCECGEDQMPIPCEQCNGRGKAVLDIDTRS